MVRFHSVRVFFGSVYCSGLFGSVRFQFWYVLCYFILSVVFIFAKLMSVRFGLVRVYSGSGLIQVTTFWVRFRYGSGHSVWVSFARSTHMHKHMHRRLHILMYRTCEVQVSKYCLLVTIQKKVLFVGLSYVNRLIFSSYFTG